MKTQNLNSPKMYHLNKMQIYHDKFDAILKISLTAIGAISTYFMLFTPSLLIPVTASLIGVGLLGLTANYVALEFFIFPKILPKRFVATSLDAIFFKIQKPLTKLTTRQNEIMEEIGTILATKGYWDLLKNYSKRLIDLGDKVAFSTHPLHIIIKMFEPAMRPLTNKIFATFLKKKSFFGSWKNSMMLFERRNQQMKYVVDFSNQMKAPLSVIKPFFINKDYDGLLNYLIKS
jgi:hypothetical protein